jgi:hypothetical protein
MVVSIVEKVIPDGSSFLSEISMSKEDGDVICFAATISTVLNGRLKGVATPRLLNADAPSKTAAANTKLVHVVLQLSLSLLLLEHESRCTPGRTVRTPMSRFNASRPGRGAQYFDAGQRSGDPSLSSVLMCGTKAAECAAQMFRDERTHCPDGRLKTLASIAFVVAGQTVPANAGAVWPATTKAMKTLRIVEF